MPPTEKTCAHCGKRLLIDHKCQCGKRFCISHRFENHACPFDHKANERKRLAGNMAKLEDTHGYTPV